MLGRVHGRCRFELNRLCDLPSSTYQLCTRSTYYSVYKQTIEMKNDHFTPLLHIEAGQRKVNNYLSEKSGLEYSEPSMFPEGKPQKASSDLY